MLTQEEKKDAVEPIPTNESMFPSMPEKTRYIIFAGASILGIFYKSFIRGFLGVALQFIGTLMVFMTKYGGFAALFSIAWPLFILSYFWKFHYVAKD